MLQSNQVEFLPCITKPDKVRLLKQRTHEHYTLYHYFLHLCLQVICVGLNYKGHCDEQNRPYPVEPFFFSKFPSTIIGPNDAVKHSSKSKVWSNY